MKWETEAIVIYEDIDQYKKGQILIYVEYDFHVLIKLLIKENTDSTKLLLSQLEMFVSITHTIRKGKRDCT